MGLIIFSGKGRIKGDCKIVSYSFSSSAVMPLYNTPFVRKVFGYIKWL